MTLAFKTSEFASPAPSVRGIGRGGAEAGIRPLCGGRRRTGSRASLFGQVRLQCGIFCCLRLL